MICYSYAQTDRWTAYGHWLFIPGRRFDLVAALEPMDAPLEWAYGHD